MKLITKHIKWIMPVSGALTCAMFYAALSPQAALLSTLGAFVSGPLAEIVVRNWGALITLLGAMLIYGAFRPIHRTRIIAVATSSKMIFTGLVLVI